jgi:uncharacterized repeat protein (TIGR02543 family)
MTRTNYIFQGWASTQAKANAGTIDYAVGATFKITANTTLYAVWNEVVTPPPPGETWGPWVRTLDPTCLTTGTDTRTSSTGRTETRTVPALGHLWGVWVQTTAPAIDHEGEETSICDRDSSHIRHRAVDRLTGGGNPDVNDDPNKKDPEAPLEQELVPTGAPSDRTPPPSDTTGQGGEISGPSVSFFGNDVPLFSGLNTKYWALVNLLLCIAGAIFAVFTLFRAIHRRRNEQEQEEFVYRDEDDGQEGKRRPGWLALAIVLGVVGVLVFIITQDMSNLMALTDSWTLLNALILIVEILAVRLAFRRKEDKEPERA